MDMMISWQTQTKKTSGKNGLQCSNWENSRILYKNPDDGGIVYKKDEISSDDKGG